MARKKLSVVRTKKYKKLVRLLAVFAVIVLVAGLIAYGWQKHEEEKYPEGTEKDYSLPNAFIDFARLINDFMTQSDEEEPVEVDEPQKDEEDEEDNIIIVGSSENTSEDESPEVTEEPEIRGGIAPKSENNGYYPFRNTLFVGDYFVVQAENLGYFEYSKFSHASGTGIDMNTIITKKTIKADGESYTVAQYAATMENIEAVYIIFSAESISWMDCPTFVKKYTAFVEEVVAAHPEAHIYVQPIIPINEEKSSKRGYTVTNKKINEINEYILALAEEKSFWVLEIDDIFITENGELSSESTTNGIRLEKEVYEVWADYILTHKAH